MKQRALLLLIVGMVQTGFCQSNEPLDDLRLGFGINITGELQSTPGINFRIAATGGVGNYVPIARDDFGMLPAVHLGILFYNKGMLGSNLNKNYYRTTFFDFFANATFTAGAKNNTTTQELEGRFVPLYHFSDFVANPLQNTFGYSLSVGSNWLMNPDKNRASQTVGFFNVNVARRGQLSYYNDGGPVLSLFGDREDRFYTGGVVISAHFNREAYIDLVELSFHKFTGWQQYAVDAADKLQLDHIPYFNEDAFGFNQQQWKLNVTSFQQGYSGYITLYDFNALDLQDFIHFSTDFPYHPDYYAGWRVATGVSSQFKTED
ncbi:hypothetical protein [Marinirhabdus gelatinilytica]|uniref:Uncharacterized protein n=1 Tax=Marinirhabdus gelatinilytica TaxID=1703343 RepID=A0A370QAY7_9FLAO|nr:hypothetical protein [Marinirhabdus gelatinilytica]RDK85533.1 hypothetical protein C8D94_103360 [Marinirhabdus gelatinilytica]